MRTLIFFAGAIALAGQDAAGWIAMGQGGSVRSVNGALTITYELCSKHFAAAVLPVDGKLAGMQRVKFRVKPDHDTAVGVLLSEKKPGGGNYTAWFWALANGWQQVELTPADFALSDGPNDPADPDGKLDLDQVEGIAIFDFAHFLGSLPENSAFPVAIDRPTGAHTLLLQNFEVLTGASPPRRANDIDAFDRGFLEWITLGGMDLKLSPAANPLGMSALQATYEETQGEFAVLLRRLSNLNLSGAKRLAFDIASERDVTLVISLELKKGARYDLTIF